MQQARPQKASGAERGHPEPLGCGERVRRKRWQISKRGRSGVLGRPGRLGVVGCWDAQDEPDAGRHGLLPALARPDTIARSGPCRRCLRTAPDRRRLQTSPAIQWEADWALRCWRAWWIVLDGFELTLPAMVAGWLTFADGVARCRQGRPGVT